MPVLEDFKLVESDLAAPAEGQALIRNRVLSMDAGFRNWMNASAGDGYLAPMALNAPVMSLTLGHVVESRHCNLHPGDCVMGRFAWEEYSTCGQDDFHTVIEPDADFPLTHYAGVLGGTGMTAYFGVKDVLQPNAGETAVISAAAGAVGSVAGQLLRSAGIKTIGLTGRNGKCDYLVRELGFDHALNYREANPADEIRNLCPDGVDLYFDNVGGPLLETLIDLMTDHGRIALCGSVATYNNDRPVPGPENLFQAVSKRLTLKGFMYTDEIERYGEAEVALAGLLRSGALINADYILEGIESAPQAFCDMLTGENIGKTLVVLQR